jgi:hypothetical protein
VVLQDMPPGHFRSSKVDHLPKRQWLHAHMHAAA